MGTVYMLNGQTIWMYATSGACLSRLLEISNLPATMSSSQVIPFWNLASEHEYSCYLPFWSLNRKEEDILLPTSAKFNLVELFRVIIDRQKSDVHQIRLQEILNSSALLFLVHTVVRTRLSLSCIDPFQHSTLLTSAVFWRFMIPERVILTAAHFNWSFLCSEFSILGRGLSVHYLLHEPDVYSSCLLPVGIIMGTPTLVVVCRLLFDRGKKLDNMVMTFATISDAILNYVLAGISTEVRILHGFTPRHFFSEVYVVSFVIMFIYEEFSSSFVFDRGKFLLSYEWGLWYLMRRDYSWILSILLTLVRVHLTNIEAHFSGKVEISDGVAPRTFLTEVFAVSLVIMFTYETEGLYYSS
ncbi:uncharacterized protein LOC113318868 isoform X1 [Papaver somniferum]|uniref:uncharacterized protein LOC113318868 isoform X1 n=1 Tax=Papaver somniferum TaxID=3469 RepID=UPI000E704A8B|nr:uncharacterized protein LOC113318868 isoform X1 [Papaver somniferum]